MTPKHWLAILLLAALPWTAWAHTNDWMAQRTGPHGGKMRSAGDYHIELVVAGNTLHVHITDHRGNPVGTQSGNGHVEYRTPSGTRRLTLQPYRTNSFMTGLEQADRPSTIRVKVHLPNQAPEETEFNLAPPLTKEKK
jgi:hypothetical protein